MQLSDFERLALSTDEPAHWKWPAGRQNKWKKAEGGIQLFYEKWRSLPFEQPRSFPYFMDLGTDDEGVSLLGFPRHTVEGKILVTNAYNEMFDRILEFRGGMGKTEGVVLTGQPGIGKSIFLRYMMVRLISARQVVVQFDGVSIDLFYAGQVYTYDGTAGFKYLPVPRKITTIPAWTMIDVDS